LHTSRRAARDADWTGEAEALGVFVPGLMGAGILLSAAILVSDGVRRLLPSRGVRRRLNVVRGVRRIVADLADAAGMAIEERNLMRRERRPWWAYGVVAAASGPLAFASARWGFDAYASAGSALEGNAIAIFYGMCGAVVAGAVALVAAAAAIPPVCRTPPLRWLVGRTPLGRLAAPPDNVADRARLLIPSLDKGDRS
jgi:hypothetical protein